MAKKIKQQIKIQLPAGKATPAPPVGPVLGGTGINMMEFLTKFNEQTREKGNAVIPVELTIYEDRSFSFITKEPPVAYLIKQALKVDKGSASQRKEKIGKLTKDQVRQIAEQKLSDLSAATVEAGMNTVAGTARSMGVDVEK
ncbi:MAG: 50S ribosomal protein L11 [Patescibacteria group bacterium]|jgi:large subunit ribosomal protein L11